MIEKYDKITVRMDEVGKKMSAERRRLIENKCAEPSDEILSLLQQSYTLQIEEVTALLQLPLLKPTPTPQPNVSSPKVMRPRVLSQSLFVPKDEAPKETPKEIPPECEGIPPECEGIPPECEGVFHFEM